MNTPSLVVLRMGSYRKKQVKRLKNGEGRLRNKIESQIDPYLTETMGRKIIPVILLYRKKQKGGVKSLLPVKFF